MSNNCPRAELTRITEKYSIDHNDVKNIKICVNRPRVGVGVILVSDLHPNAVLIGERKNSHGDGKYALPGGHLEYDESWFECAKKEIAEECGIMLDKDSNRHSVIHVTNDIMLDDQRHYITIFMAVKINNEQTVSIINGEPNKCKEWEWLPIDSIHSKSLFIPLQNFIQENGFRLLINFIQSCN